jgi:hypothetical protein
LISFNFLTPGVSQTIGNLINISKHFRSLLFPVTRHLSSGSTQTGSGKPGAMIASNSVMDGGVIALRITTSLSPTTTNCIPECSLSRFRISSGKTTWPFLSHSPLLSPVVIAYCLFLRYLIQNKTILKLEENSFYKEID